MLSSIPYSDNHVIECVCDCAECTTADGRHLNCMTTGNRWLKSEKYERGLDYCPCGNAAAPKWRFVDAIYCDQCDNPFHEVIDWWNDDDVMTYIHELTGLTREEQIKSAQLYLCPNCIAEIKAFVNGGEQYEQWKAQRHIEQEIAKVEHLVEVR